MDKELTNMECERIDFLQDRAREFLGSLMLKGESPEWTLDDLDRVINAAWNCVKDKKVKFTEREFYPYRDEEGSEGNVQAIENMVNEINKYTRLLLAYEDEGFVCIEYTGEQKQAVADAIEEALPYGMTQNLKWVKSDEAMNMAWYKVKPTERESRPYRDEDDPSVDCFDWEPLDAEVDDHGTIPKSCENCLNRNQKTGKCKLEEKD